MSKIRLMWLLLAMAILCVTGHGRAEASKVAMDSNEVHVDPAQATVWPREEEVTAAITKGTEAPAAEESTEGQPMQYDALPEHHRHRNDLEEMLNPLAEV